MKPIYEISLRRAISIVMEFHDPAVKK